MSSITELWKKSRETFDQKTLVQILSFAGDGKLKDGNSTSKEFRELLYQVPSKLLQQFADNCLAEKFEDGGLALQDVINQIGTRLGFAAEDGLYRGKQHDVGFDGIWTAKDGHSIVVEVKTSDAYRINLDVIARYRSKLIEQNRISKDKSSILIIVGRQDTGDLEAQIRGSVHAWDIRLISSDSLLKLLSLKETLNDNKTIQQINELLKPKEYTRIDKLIDLIFITSKDLQLEDPIEQEVEFVSSKGETAKENVSRPNYVNFHEECLVKIHKKLRIDFIKHSRVSFTNKEKTVGLICSVSKAHKKGKYNKFWFAFHPHQQEFLREFSKSYIAYGCGSASKTFLIPFRDFESWVKNFWTTEKEERMYYHVIIHEKDDGVFFLQQPKNINQEMIDISKFRI